MKFIASKEDKYADSHQVKKNPMRKMSNSEIEKYIDSNVNDFEDVKRMLKDLAKAVYLE